MKTDGPKRMYRVNGNLMMFQFDIKLIFWCTELAEFLLEKHVGAGLISIGVSLVAMTRFHIFSHLQK